MVVLWIVLAVIGVHALLLGRMPGPWLQQRVRQPRLWGAGAILILISWNRSPTLLVIGIGLIALGHAVKSPR
jgi:CHASE2 domain-containing sensor protein